MLIKVVVSIAMKVLVMTTIQMMMIMMVKKMI